MESNDRLEFWRSVAQGVWEVADMALSVIIRIREEQEGRARL